MDLWHGVENLTLSLVGFFFVVVRDHVPWALLLLVSLLRVELGCDGRDELLAGLLYWRSS